MSLYLQVIFHIIYSYYLCRNFIQVVSFTGENKDVSEHDKALKIAYKAAIQQGLASGFGVGFVQFIMFCSYALALWYGSWLIINEGYSCGRVINVILEIMTGGMYVESLLSNVELLLHTK